MSWTAPATVVAGQLMTAAFWNTHVRDNEGELRQGGIAISSQAAGDLIYATSASQFGRIAAVAAGALLVSNGTGAAPVYNSTAISITSGNIVNFGAQPRAKVTWSGLQSIPNATFTSLTWDGEYYDVGSMHDTVTNNSRLTVPAGGDGVYLIIGQIEFATSSTGLRALRILKNGTTTLAAMQTAGASSTNPTIQQIVVLHLLAAGDYIEIQAYQDTGGNLNVGDSGVNYQHNFTAGKIW